MSLDALALQLAALRPSGHPPDSDSDDDEGSAAPIVKPKAPQPTGSSGSGSPLPSKKSSLSPISSGAVLSSTALYHSVDLNDVAAIKAQLIALGADIDNPATKPKTAGRVNVTRAPRRTAGREREVLAKFQDLKRLVDAENAKQFVTDLVPRMDHAVIALKKPHGTLPVDEFDALTRDMQKLAVDPAIHAAVVKAEHDQDTTFLDTVGFANARANAIAQLVSSV